MNPRGPEQQTEEIIQDTEAEDRLQIGNGLFMVLREDFKKILFPKRNKIPKLSERKLKEHLDKILKKHQASGKHRTKQDDSRNMRGATRKLSLALGNHHRHIQNAQHLQEAISEANIPHDHPWFLLLTNIKELLFRTELLLPKTAEKPTMQRALNSDKGIPASLKRIAGQIIGSWSRESSQETDNRVIKISLVLSGMLEECDLILLKMETLTKRIEAEETATVFESFIESLDLSEENNQKARRILVKFRDNVTQLQHHKKKQKTSTVMKRTLKKHSILP